MIELFSVSISFLFLFLLSLFPFRINFFEQKHIFRSFGIFDILLLNLIIHISLILLISFINIDYSKYFISIIIISIFYNFYNFLKIKRFLKYFQNKNFIFFIILNFFIAIYLISNPILAWDGLENWFFKAQNFFYNYNFFDLSGLIGNNNYYPHLGTLVWGFFWKNSFLQYEYLGRLIYIYIYLLSLFSICELISNQNKIKIILLSLILIISFDEFLFRGYQEVLLFSLFIFISKNYYIYLSNKNFINLLICFICLNLIPWIKHEGFLFVLIYTISLLFMIKFFKNKLELFSIVILTWILLAIKNFIFYKFLDLNFTHGGGGIIFTDYKTILEFIFIFSKGLLIAIFKYKIWILILFSIYYFLKNELYKNEQKLYFKFLKINLVLYFMLLLGIYYNLYLNGNIDFNWWIDNSLDRLIYSLSGIFVINIIFFVNYIKNYNLK